jgi:parvulin-like peptidyl-prolyl isomerase
MKPPARFTVPAFLLLFAGLCFPQSDAKVQKTPPKASAAPSVAAPKSQPESAENEKIPKPGPDAIFPAVVARVNGEAILGQDLEELVRRELSAIGNPEWKKLRGEYRGEVTVRNLTALINSKLLYQKATASGMKAADTDVKSELQRIAKTFKSDAEMDSALASQQMDRTSLEKNVHENLTMSKYVEETINKKITVAPEEMADYYSKNPEEFRHPDVIRTSHILIQAAGKTPEEDAKAKDRAETLLARIKKGEDFAKLARENSMDSSASEGGDMGFNSKESLMPDYSQTAFSLPVGGVKLVKIQSGYYIIKVTDKKKEGSFTLEEIKPRLIEVLKKKKSNEALNKLINELREKANIEILISAGEVLNP